MLITFWQSNGSPAYDRFQAAFSERYKASPMLQFAAVPAYDAAVLLLAAMRREAGKRGVIETARVRRDLLHVTDYSGASGVITFDPDGAVRTIQERLYRLQDGVLTEYAPPKKKKKRKAVPTN